MNCRIRLFLFVPKYLSVIASVERVAQTKQMISSCHSVKDDVTACNNIPEQEQYCIPIKMNDQLIGVLNLFIEKGHIRTSDEDNFLLVITNTLAGIIVRCQQDEQLEESKTIAEQATKEKSDFLANMSHEIRSPMNAILGMGEVLAESQLNIKQRRYVQIINNAGEGLLSLINDILDMSKIEAGLLEIEAIQFDPKEIAISSVDIFKTEALKKEIVISTEFDNAISDQVVGDPQRIRQIMINLLSNAVKFTEKGTITLSVVQTVEKTVHFSVTDSGIGIPNDRLEKIFPTIFAG